MPVTSLTNLVPFRGGSISPSVIDLVVRDRIFYRGGPQILEPLDFATDMLHRRICVAAPGFGAATSSADTWDEVCELLIFVMTTSPIFRDLADNIE